jgi:hypothetical protein
MSLDTPHLSYSWRDDSADEGAGIDGKVEHREECLELSVLLRKLELVPCNHGRMNYKDTKPYMSAFLSVDLLTEFVAFCLTDFIDWRYIHSWFVFSTQLVNCCPHGRKNYTCVACTVATLLYLLSDLLLPHPLPNVQYIQTVCDCGGEGGVGGC